MRPLTVDRDSSPFWSFLSNNDRYFSTQSLNRTSTPLPEEHRSIPNDVDTNVNTPAIPEFIQREKREHLISKAEPGGRRSTVDEVLQDIPVFTARAGDLVIPSARSISDEIRQTKSKLARLQKIQIAARELRRHKNLMENLLRD